MTTPKEETPQCPECGTTALKLANPSQHGSHVCGNRNCANGCFYPATPPLDRAAHIAAMHEPLVAMLEKIESKLPDDLRDLSPLQMPTKFLITLSAAECRDLRALIAQAKEGAQ